MTYHLLGKYGQVLVRSGHPLQFSVVPPMNVRLAFLSPPLPVVPSKLQNQTHTSESSSNSTHVKRHITIQSETISNQSFHLLWKENLNNTPYAFYRLDFVGQESNCYRN